ncbi:MAG: hypothetical protein ACKOZY_11405, partial [Flavobacteriales bacterium]
MRTFALHAMLLLTLGYGNSPHTLSAQESGPVHASGTAMEGDSTDMRFGLYIDNISNIDYAHHTYNVVFYVWNNTIGE